MHIEVLPVLELLLTVGTRYRRRRRRGFGAQCRLGLSAFVFVLPVQGDRTLVPATMAVSVKFCKEENQW